MSGHHASCPDCVPCRECPLPSDIAYCADEPHNAPCPHGEPLCGEHNLEFCLDCRLDAEREMHRSGDYGDGSADPFFRGETADSLDLAAWHAENEARNAERKAAADHVYGRKTS